MARHERTDRAVEEAGKKHPRTSWNLHWQNGHLLLDQHLAFSAQFAAHQVSLHCDGLAINCKAVGHLSCNRPFPDMVLQAFHQFPCLRVWDPDANDLSQVIACLLHDRAYQYQKEWICISCPEPEVLYSQNEMINLIPG